MVAQARWPRNRKTILLEPHREELIRLRQTGESVASICAGLRGLGVEISPEALRVWFNALIPRRKRKRKPLSKAGTRTESGAGAESAPPPAVPDAGLPAQPMESLAEKLRRLHAVLPPCESTAPRRGPRIARDDF